ncbi:helix-turn-helix transcriptional regulator [Paenibacillus beijingensis]|uniref:HTH deoR-type domain-containing protein n=1 Tax=Paenibacillus beijingensis TaxID=1126833 RepID=A0A0D5NMC6_9BACL|nr:YafY family protein [Paenibacillus beijingensis]AJY76088.1 hypothetical protein VN24_17885 [Paenibacillus beijingensis]
MRGDRLLSIMLLLQAGRKLTAKQLAARLEVSERTILRDMDALGSAGVPVVSDRGAKGGWSLMEGYRTNLTGLTTSELEALHLFQAKDAAADLGLSKELKSVWIKLQAALPAASLPHAEFVRERLHVDGAGWHQVKEDTPFLALVQEAVWKERRLRFRYSAYREPDLPEVEEKNRGEVRTVNPYGLIVKGHLWYLAAEHDGQMRSYRISRMKEAEMTAETFSRPSSFSLGDWWEQSVRSFKERLPRFAATVLLTDAGLAKLRRLRYVELTELKRRHRENEAVSSLEHIRPGIGSRQLAPGQEPGYEARLLFDSEEAASDIILTLHGEAEVAAPAQLRERIALLAEQVAQRHR